ncbi:B3 domain-containing protein REM-like 1 [Silene latifolia]|uniref:B3 domain-containing protein REM-like 1 n=1 Tax=Silene latifolia TaxID=37657 RepID=UPI003D77E76B
MSFAGNKMAFSVKIHKYKTHQFSQLTIPKVISLSQNLASKDEVILQDAMGNRWPVKIRHREDGRAILMHGWKAFLKDNEVAAGDTLNFEVVSDGLIQVGVLKKYQDERKSNEAMSQNGEAIAPIMYCEALDDHTANVNPAEDSVSTKRGRKRGSSEYSSSSFTFLWRPNTTGSYLHIPKVIIEGQNLMNKDSVVLRDPNGKCWPLEVSTRRDGRVALTKGWVDFWKGHDIKAGDSLHFDFVSEYFIQVNIDRGKPLNSPLKTGQHEQHEHVVPLSLTDDDEPAT